MRELYSLHIGNATDLPVLAEQRFRADLAEPVLQKYGVREEKFTRHERARDSRIIDAIIRDVRQANREIDHK